MLYNSMLYNQRYQLVLYDYPGILYNIHIYHVTNT